MTGPLVILFLLVLGFLDLVCVFVSLGPLPSDGRENGMEEVEKSGHIGHHHCRNIQSVDLEKARKARNLHSPACQNGDVCQNHRRTEVENHCHKMITNIQGGPDAALIASAEEDEEPEGRHYEAEDRHEHHPAQRVGWLD